jgi:hypothetical protein
LRTSCLERSLHRLLALSRLPASTQPTCPTAYNLYSGIGGGWIKFSHRVSGATHIAGRFRVCPTGSRSKEDCEGNNRRTCCPRKIDLDSRSVTRCICSEFLFRSLYLLPKSHIGLLEFFLGKLCIGRQFSWRTRGFGEFIGFWDVYGVLCAG